LPDGDVYLSTTETETDRQQKKVVRWSPEKIQTDLVRHIEINTFQVIDQKNGLSCHLVSDCPMERCNSMLQRQTDSRGRKA
jgi:hypothetical protein